MTKNLACTHQKVTYPCSKQNVTKSEPSTTATQYKTRQTNTIYIMLLTVPIKWLLNHDYKYKYVYKNLFFSTMILLYSNTYPLHSFLNRNGDTQ